MNIRYNITGQDRKNLVAALATILNQPSRYEGAPGFCYTVGEYSISKTGELTGPDSYDLVTTLEEQHGFKPVDEVYENEAAAAEPIADQPKKPKGIMDTLVDALNEHAEDGAHWQRMHRAPTIIDNSGREHNLDGTFAAKTEISLLKDETTAEETEDGMLTIEMPMEGFDVIKLDNLAKLLASKESLLKMALSVDELPIRVRGDRIAFAWFPYTEDSATIFAYSQLIAAICNTAKEKTRVTAKPQDYPNPKFTMRCWMIHLGLVGPEFKLIRKLMCAGLPGNGAFSKGYDPRKVAKAEETPAEEIAAADAAGDALPGEEGADDE